MTINDAICAIHRQPAIEQRDVFLVSPEAYAALIKEFCDKYGIPLRVDNEYSNFLLCGREVRPHG